MNCIFKKYFNLPYHPLMRKVVEQLILNVYLGTDVKEMNKKMEKTRNGKNPDRPKKDTVRGEGNARYLIEFYLHQMKDNKTFFDLYWVSEFLTVIVSVNVSECVTIDWHFSRLFSWLFPLYCSLKSH